MGTTPWLKLPYPELNDPANVPTDMRKLAEAVEAVIGGALPQPITRSTLTSQNISSTTNQNLSPTVSVTNPHASLFLLVMINFGVWVDASGNVFYGSLKLTGQSGLAEVVIPRVQDTYQSAESQAVATVAPGATLTALLMGRRLNTSNQPSVSSNRGSLSPMGWLKTGAIQ